MKFCLYMLVGSLTVLTTLWLKMSFSADFHFTVNDQSYAGVSDDVVRNTSIGLGIYFAVLTVMAFALLVREINRA